MKTFMRENKGKLLLLLFLILCLVVLRTVNIHQVWYYLTSWENLGAPPKPAEKIMEIKLPEPGGDQSVIVYVKGPNRDYFGCCSLTEEKGWALSDKPYYEFYGSPHLEPGLCADLIKDEWNIQENPADAKRNLEAGQCHPSFLYSAYQIGQDGSVRRKIIDEKAPSTFKQISFEVVLCLLLIDLILLALSVRKKIHVQNRIDPLKADTARLILVCLIVVAIGAMAFRYFSDIDEKIQREIPGEYVRGFGAFGSYRLILHSDQSYSAEITLENRTYELEGGRYSVKNGRIIFLGSVKNRSLEDIFSISSYLVPVQWGERIYLVEKTWMARFCENDLDWEPREDIGWSNFLRQDDWKLPAKGEPRFMDGRKACP